MDKDGRNMQNAVERSEMGTKVWKKPLKERGLLELLVTV